MELVVDNQGQIVGVYDDAVDWHALGRVIVRRAGSVEPDADGFWHVDLGPVGGPVLGPFARRREALAAERRWLAADNGDRWRSAAAGG